MVGKLTIFFLFCLKRENKYWVRERERERGERERERERERKREREG